MDKLQSHLHFANAAHFTACQSSLQTHQLVLIRYSTCQLHYISNKTSTCEVSWCPQQWYPTGNVCPLPAPTEKLMGKSMQGRGERVLLNTLIDEAFSSTAVCQITTELEEAEKGRRHLNADYCWCCKTRWKPGPSFKALTQKCTSNIT